MTELACFRLADGTDVTVETPASGGVSPAGMHAKAMHAAKTFSDALQPVTAAAAEVVAKFRELPGRPEEVEISFGVRLDGSLGAVIATAAAGAHLDVTLRWTQKKTDDKTEGM